MNVKKKSQADDARDHRNQGGAPRQEDVREKTLDKTLDDSFPASDPPSTLPDPDVDAFAA